MSKKHSSRKKWIILAIVAIVVAVAVGAGLKGGDTGIEVTVREVERGDITSIVTATGRVQPETEIVISSEVPGEIVEIGVRDGDLVERGDLLVRVNPDTLEAQAKQQEASLMSTRASAAQRRAEMLQAELDLKRIEELSGKGFSTRDELDQMRTRLEVAKSAHEAALFQIQRQEMQLKEANDQLSKASIYSPITGTVFGLKAEIGDRVVGTGQFAGTEIMRVANLDNMEVQVDVSESDIINVAIGDVASIEVDALPDTKVSGRVTEIANSADTSDSRSQEQLTTFQVRIKLDEATARLRPGMTATADIETETVTDVVKAPLGSVVVRPRREVEKPAGGEAEAARPVAEESGDDESDDTAGRGRGAREDRVRVVFVVDGDKAVLRRVETGIADRDSMEIKSGLEAGERIVTGSYRALTRELKDGSAISEREAGPPRRD
jgi:HlyD family secretion protein